ncbi:MAG: 30S ribosomal protein S9 [Candidatus Glassbacteria bacterium]|nr:30S ribosomal protein S9 [Candidatus Glassbacteria bacterium]
MDKDSNVVKTVGRRKSSVARVFVSPGKGEWVINGRSLSDYFVRPTHVQLVEQPLAATETVGQYKIRVNVSGGGVSGQAGAIRLGLARALVELDEAHRSALRKEGLLTRDPRMVERKKYGQPKARKRFQFSKR